MNASEGYTANESVEYLDLAIAEKFENEQYWKEQKRWTFGSLPDVELLDLYGLQFDAYSNTAGLYGTMREYASEISSNALKSELALEKSETLEDVKEHGREKRKRMSFLWKRIRKYIRKRAAFIRRLFFERR